MKVLDNSFVQFVYPFLFDAGQFDQRAAQIDRAVYTGGKGPANIWTSQSIDDAGVLPHVARYLNSADGAAMARIWAMDGNAVQSHHCLGAGSNVEWHFVRQGKSEVPFRIGGVQLYLFRVGVGLLVLRVQPEISPAADGDTLAGWLEFIHFFRYLRRARTLYLRVQRREFQAATRESSLCEYFPPLASAANEAGARRVLYDLIEGLLRTACPKPSVETWWRHVFIAHQALPYVGLFVEQASPEQERSLLYKLHNFFHPGEGENPAAVDLELAQPHLVPYADRQWFVFSLDGAGFLACDPPDTEFFRATLPNQLETTYLLVYLLVLHQRFALMGLTEDVSAHWLLPTGVGEGTSDVEREQVFRRIRDTLLSFTARGYFAQVVQRRHHHRCYQKWQEVFQVERLFREVSEEVREMHDYLQMRKTEQLQELAQQQQVQTGRAQRRMDLFAAFLAIPLLILSWLEAGGIGMIEPEGGTKVLATTGFLIVGFVLGALFMRWLQRADFRS